TNLLSNAAKYSERGTPITVQAAATHGSVRIEVVDRGVGLTPDEAARVFDPFWRAAHVATTHLRGTGLGLARVTESVRVMGGAVVLLVRPGRRASAADGVRREIIRNDCFDRLREELGDRFDAEIERRVRVVAGDVGLDGLGLSDEDRALFASCDVVAHSAAAV